MGLCVEFYVPVQKYPTQPLPYLVPIGTLQLPQIQRIIKQNLTKLIIMKRLIHNPPTILNNFLNNMYTSFLFFLFLSLQPFPQHNNNFLYPTLHITYNGDSCI